jgi:pSer/pThr/pTyr-binding forkhead associated (FHA) protein
MARLILSLDGQTMAEYTMNKERYTIGRLPDNDIRIDNPAVSGHHSLIINILNDSFLEDLNSTNGTYVNGKLIKKHALQHGDIITVGHHQLRFIEEDDQQDEFEKTMVIQPSARPLDAVRRAEARVAGMAAMVGVAASRPAPAVASAPAAAAPAAAPVAPVAPAAASGLRAPPSPDLQPVVKPARLQVLSGQFAGRELGLTKTLTTLGRPGIQVAAITRRANGYYIVHVESAREGDFPQVNGRPIGAQAQRLDDNDVIQLAGVKMSFFLD